MGRVPNAPASYDDNVEISNEPCSHESPSLRKTPKKRLSCINCRKRRKKCDLKDPCGRCVELGIECVYNEVDLRKQRYNPSYVKDLENNLAEMKLRMKQFAQLANDLLPDDAKGIKKILVNDVLTGGTSAPDINALTRLLKDEASWKSSNNDLINVKNETTYDVNKTHTLMVPDNSSSNQDFKDSTIRRDVSSSSLPDSLTEHDILRKKRFVKGSIYPEGPTSYKKRKLGNNVIVQPSSTQRIDDLKSTVIVRTNSDPIDGRLNTDPDIIQSLCNFYKWLYPGNFIFMHRESFLYGFFNNTDKTYDNSQYCSEELIYAVAAIGSRLSKDLHEKSEMYYDIAKTRLLKIVFDEQSMPKITTVQALLCLAFYELGNGETQLSWYFSGLAIRVGYDMGFQLDPKVWITEDSIHENQTLSDSESEIRSRIYWGCYIADHFISLILGRAPSLTVSNSTVPESDELPEIEGTEDFRYESQTVLQVSLPLKNLMILSRIIQIFTSKIFIEPNTTMKRIEYLKKFNLKVSNWRQSLPDFLQWSKELVQSVEISTDPTISYFWYHYYIVLITFNKPFMEDCEEAKLVILDLLLDLKTLLNNLNLKFGNDVAKCTLYHLYTCLLSMSCFQKLQQMPQDAEIDAHFPDIKSELKWFKSVFDTQALIYDLPNKIEQEDLEHDQHDPTHQGFHQINNIHDFSLSDEIDELIKQVFGFDQWNLNPSYQV